MSEQQPRTETRVATVEEVRETAFAMALLWALPVLALVLALVRL